MSPSTTLRWAFRLLILSLPFAPALRAQGPISGFPTPKGEVVVAGQYSVDSYETYLLPDDQTEARDITTRSYSLFVEAGLSENTALVGTLPYMWVNDRDGSLQDAAIWLKYMNLDKRADKGAHRFFTAAGLSFPVGNYEVVGETAIGQRATTFQGRLTYQFQHDSGFFISGQSGIDFQFAPDDRASWPLLLRGGFGGRYLYVEGWLEFITALGDNGQQLAVAGTGSSWQRTGITAYVPVTPWAGLTVGGAVILGGEFIGKSNRLNLGVVVKI